MARGVRTLDVCYDILTHLAGGGENTRAPYVPREHLQQYLAPHGLTEDLTREAIEWWQGLGVMEQRETDGAVRLCETPSAELRRPIGSTPMDPPTGDHPVGAPAREIVL
eukprot:8610894-Alexandrium_andersonii.AAC.1